MAHVMIIGANRGIGLALARALTDRGDRVTAVCRSSSEALEALAGIEVIDGVDITDRDALDSLARRVGPSSIDTLFVVAGVLDRVSLDTFDAEIVRREFEVNALGPLQAVVALRAVLRDGGKIGLTTSRMGSLADNGSGGSYAYRMSKAALNMAGVSLARDLAPRRIAVRLLHPGYVRTEMTGHSGHIDAAEAAAGLIARIDELTLATSGTFVHQNGEPLPW